MFDFAVGVIRGIVNGHRRSRISTPQEQFVNRAIARPVKDQGLVTKNLITRVKMVLPTKESSKPEIHCQASLSNRMISGGGRQSLRGSITRRSDRRFLRQKSLRRRLRKYREPREPFLRQVDRTTCNDNQRVLDLFVYKRSRGTEIVVPLQYLRMKKKDPL